MALFRPVVLALRTGLAREAVLERVARYIGESPVLPTVQETRVIDGSLGEDRFTVRYAHPYGVVAAVGRVRSREGGCLVTLQFQEERPDILRVLGVLAATIALEYVFAQDGFGWLEVGIDLVGLLGC